MSPERDTPTRKYDGGPPSNVPKVDRALYTPAIKKERK